MLHVIAKVPVPGHTKTRLIPALGPEGAAALSAAMTADVLETVQATGLPWRVHFSGPADHAWLIGLPAIPQVQGDLGARLTSALVAGGIAVGTDCVLLSSTTLLGAHARLVEGAHVVLGLAPDGGYTFVAASAHAVAMGVFEHIPWSTAQTATAQLSRAKLLNLRPETVDGTFDVDEPADLERLKAALRGLPPSIARHTRRALDTPHKAGLARAADPR